MERKDVERRVGRRRVQLPLLLLRMMPVGLVWHRARNASSITSLQRHDDDVAFPAQALDARFRLVLAVCEGRLHCRGAGVRFRARVERSGTSAGTGVEVSRTWPRTREHQVRVWRSRSVVGFSGLLMKARAMVSNWSSSSAEMWLRGSS